MGLMTTLLPQFYLMQLVFLLTVMWFIGLLEIIELNHLECVNLLMVTVIQLVTR